MHENDEPASGFKRGEPGANTGQNPAATVEAQIHLATRELHFEAKFLEEAFDFFPVITLDFNHVVFK